MVGKHVGGMSGCCMSGGCLYDPDIGIPPYICTSHIHLYATYMFLCPHISPHMSVWHPYICTSAYICTSPIHLYAPCVFACPRIPHMSVYLICLYTLPYIHMSPCTYVYLSTSVHPCVSPYICMSLVIHPYLYMPYTSVHSLYICTPPCIYTCIRYNSILQ